MVRVVLGVLGERLQVTILFSRKEVVALLRWDVQISGCWLEYQSPAMMRLGSPLIFDED